jgi:hypothetical protein
LFELNFQLWCKVLCESTLLLSLPSQQITATGRLVFDIRRGLKYGFLAMPSPTRFSVFFPSPDVSQEPFSVCRSRLQMSHKIQKTKILRVGSFALWLPVAIITPFGYIDKAFETLRLVDTLGLLSGFFLRFC